MSQQAARATSLPAEISKDIRSGEVLAGDDFTSEQLRRWYAEEKEAFFQDDEGNSHVDPYYAYMRSLTARLGRVALGGDAGRRRSLLVLGPGPGLEVDAAIRGSGPWSITFVEASEQFCRDLSTRFPDARVLPAREDGILPAESQSVDVILALSVLHHIPNVSFVLREFRRLLRPNGFAILREPCSSMGDWRGPRAATPNERGISRRWMLAALSKAGMDVVGTPVPVLFYPLARITKASGAGWLMRTPVYYWLDRCVSRVAALNDRYWRDSWVSKLGPGAYFYVCRARPETGAASSESA